MYLFIISIENPYEYEQAQNYLKQMEIECMNFMESEYANSEGDAVRARISKAKQEFNAVRREIRQIQQAWERNSFQDASTEDQVSYPTFTYLEILIGNG